MIGPAEHVSRREGFITPDLFGKWRKIGGGQSNYFNIVLCWQCQSSFLSTNKLRISDTSWSYKDDKVGVRKTDLYLGVCPYTV